MLRAKTNKQTNKYELGRISVVVVVDAFVFFLPVYGHVTEKVTTAFSVSGFSCHEL